MIGLFYRLYLVEMSPFRQLITAIKCWYIHQGTVSQPPLSSSLLIFRCPMSAMETQTNRKTRKGLHVDQLNDSFGKDIRKQM
jgi:hypothetical protein